METRHEGSFVFSDFCHPGFNARVRRGFSVAYGHMDWPAERIAKVEGRRGGLATLVITDQQGGTFAGRLKRSNPTGDEDEPLWGAFTPGGKLMIGSDEEGTYIFTLINRNTLDYCYSETGASPRSVCARLIRQRPGR
jgi:hypothetical protein